jgi:hypothetical protein
VSLEIDLLLEHRPARDVEDAPHDDASRLSAGVSIDRRDHAGESHVHLSSGWRRRYPGPSAAGIRNGGVYGLERVRNNATNWSSSFGARSETAQKDISPSFHWRMWKPFVSDAASRRPRDRHRR